MALADLETASQFLKAAEVALQTGEREAVYALLAPDIEWITPQRTLQGIDGIKDELTWGKPSESSMWSSRRPTEWNTVMAASAATCTRSTA